MRDTTIQQILESKLFAVIRLKDTSTLPIFVERIVSAGITIIEVTLNSGDALGAIEMLVHKFPQCVIGAGTVIGKRDSENAVAAGAKFLVSPIVDSKMVAIAHENDLAAISGALTPTEVHQAHAAGADFVKLFPLAGLGAGYIRALRGPMPNIRYIATNGVTPENAGEFLASGCSAVGLGSSLITDEDVANSRFDHVGELARKAVAAVQS